MIQHTKSNLTSLHFENLTNFKNLIHFVTTRNGGISSLPYRSLNLGFHTGDRHDDVLVNRQIVADALGISIESFTVGQQTHSGNVTIVQADGKGRGAKSHDTAFPNVDALITASPQICLLALLADCTPIILFDPHKMVVALAHAGRHGVVNGIVGNTINSMKSVFDCDPRNMLVGIGPSITAKNYAIKDESAAELFSALGSQTQSLTRSQNGFHFDLATAHEEQLVSSGIPVENIEESGLCTYEHPDLFFSERRDGVPTGRFGAAIMLT